jgi:catechol 2,3-dioxygenase-like lactoylglutathione lyase family enzyme
MRNIIKRTTLIVRDADKATAWYEEVLGLKCWYDSEFVLSGVGLAVGGAGDKTHLVILKAEDPVIGMIGLLQWVDPPLDAPSAIPTRVQFGAPIFVVDSDDARGVCERGRRCGSHIYAEPHEWSTKGADGKMKHFVSTSIFDLDGYFYEINQVLRTDA